MNTLFPPDAVTVLTVGELTRCIKEVIEESFSAIWVEGEVSNLKKHSSGHWYFSLKDAEATLAAALFRGVNLRLKFDLRDGMKIVVQGHLDVYAPRGQYNLIVEQVLPKGIGPLELAYRQTREKLFKLGYFDAARKKPVPAVPWRLALVTSATGSAIRDMLETLGRRWPAAEIWVRPVRVQGEGAREEIAAAIDLLNGVGGPGSSAPVDVVILGRGGGSLEDLWAFNEEIVARAIFQSLIPIVTGIGHEDDYTIADMVADLRGLTPTDAAAKVVPDRADKLQHLTDLESRLRGGLWRRLDLARRQLAEVAVRRCFRAPFDRVRDEERRVGEMQERLDRAMRQRLQQCRQKMEGAAARLETLSPLNVLTRGYSLTRKEHDNLVVRNADQVQPGERIVTVVQRGRIISRVEEVGEKAEGRRQKAEGERDHDHESITCRQLDF